MNDDMASILIALAFGLAVGWGASLLLPNDGGPARYYIAGLAGGILAARILGRVKPRGRWANPTLLRFAAPVAGALVAVIGVRILL